jgi:hypothetical protein
MTRVRLALLGGLLIALLGLLLAGLAGIEFRGPRGGAGGDEGLLPGPDGALPRSGPEWLLDAIMVALFALVAAQVVGCILSREYRAKCLRGLLLLIALIVVADVITNSLRPMLEDVLVGEEAPLLALPEPSLDREDEEEAPSPPRVPPWLAYLAGGIGGGVLAWWGGRRLWPRPESVTDEIQDAAESATAELAQGLPVSDVVIRCWLRMVEILSPHVSETRVPSLTPHELAERLVGLGFREEPVRALTQLFEEVRYGHKESEPRRDEALAALAAIERACG